MPTATPFAETEPPLLAVLVGGRARRMGGVPKGRLPAPDGSGRSLLQALLDLAPTLRAPVVLVGDAEAYTTEAHGVPRLSDAPEGRGGPLAGLLSAWRYARDRSLPGVWLLGCDLVGVEAAHLEALWRAVRGGAAPAVASLWGGRRQPLPSLWRCTPGVEAVLVGELRGGRGALRGALDALSAQWVRVASDGVEDWDTPAEAARRLGASRARAAIEALSPAPRAEGAAARNPVTGLDPERGGGRSP